MNAYPRDATAPSEEPPVLLTKSDSAGDNLSRTPRALLVGTAGTANLVYASGAVSSVPLQVGYNPLGGVLRIATGGTADNIWAIY